MSCMQLCLYLYIYMIVLFLCLGLSADLCIYPSVDYSTVFHPNLASLSIHTHAQTWQNLTSKNFNSSNKNMPAPLSHYPSTRDVPFTATASIESRHRLATSPILRYSYTILCPHFVSSLRIFVAVFKSPTTSFRPKYLKISQKISRSCHEVVAWQFQWQCSGDLP